MGIELTKHYKCLASLKTWSNALMFCVNIHLMYDKFFVKEKRDATTYHLVIYHRFPYQLNNKLKLPN